MNEFELIRRFFTRPAPGAGLGVGDDCALLAARPGVELAVTTDLLASGTHFLPDVEPRLLGHKALAVNLSDLASMGALPRWALLALALPSVDEAWLAAFSEGLFALAEAHEVDLVGGDTTRGPLTLCLTLIGEVPAGRALRRSGARVGDELWVSGALGSAALGVALRGGRIDLPPALAAEAGMALDRPQPRLALGRGLIGLASAAIDVSDGLIADLGHVLEASGVGARVGLERVPRGPALARALELDRDLALECLLAGGDDYELLFAAPPSAHGEIERLGASLGLRMAHIGEVAAGSGLEVLDPTGRRIALARGGFDHFGG